MSSDTTVIARRLLHDWAFQVESPTRADVAATITYLADRLGEGDRAAVRAVHRALWREWFKIASAPLAVELLLWRLGMETASH